MRRRLAAFVLCMALTPVARAASDDALTAWQSGVKVGPVSAEAGRHSIHAYFNTTPESPDGRYVLFYSSSTPEGHAGELRIRDRAAGRETTVARDITTEDAHRAACQQWACGGRQLLFHNLCDGRWEVVAVEIATLKQRVLATGRQLAFGQPSGPWAAIYGMHWNPGAHKDLELVNVETGQLHTAVTAAAVKAAYPAEIAREFGDREVSIFFPILSPDLKRVFFKMASPLGGDFRSSRASHRALLVCYDLDSARFLFLRQKWGHPAWFPDSQAILEVGHLRIDAATGATGKIAGLPKFPGSHPSVSPDGRLFVTDTLMEPFGGKKGEWGIVVGSMRGNEYTVIHRFDNSRGARSWRKSDPHPAFSADGRRIYFNTSDTAWTRLFVAERP